MFTRPVDLSDSQVAEALLALWGITTEELEYAPVGFGSYHWRCVATKVDAVGGDGVSGRWFVTVDDLRVKLRDSGDSVDDARQRLTEALNATRALYRSGLHFVVAPQPTTAGEVIGSIGARFAIALYPYIEGETWEWGPFDTRTARTAVVDRLVAIHSANPLATARPPTDDFSIPLRSALMTALDDPHLSWGPGPYAERARELLRRHAGPLRDALRQYDVLAASVAARPDRFVVTHGEPHRANTIGTASGIYLIDWDTTLFAPPERDLWAMIAEDPGMSTYYTDLAGIELDPAALGLFRLWWDLCEVSLFINDFRRPHVASADTRVGWSGLRRHLNPARWVDLTRPDVV